MFTRPVLFDDRLLIEPTGGAVRLPGASVAEFREHRIRAFRHYFDDSELLAGAPGTPEPPALDRSTTDRRRRDVVTARAAPRRAGRRRPRASTAPLRDDVPSLR